MYFLYRDHRLIYIGVAANGATIQECLQRHLRGEGEVCTRRATEFSYEPAPDPLPLYWVYVNVYRESTRGLLPDCNQDSEQP